MWDDFSQTFYPSVFSPTYAKCRSALFFSRSSVVKKSTGSYGELACLADIEFFIVNHLSCDFLHPKIWLKNNNHVTYGTVCYLFEAEYIFKAY